MCVKGECVEGECVEGECVEGVWKMSVEDECECV